MVNLEHRMRHDFLNFAPSPDWITPSCSAALVRLGTAADLEGFWQAWRGRLPYAATAGALLTGDTYLEPRQWVFARSPEDVVKAVTRWADKDIHAEWRPWGEESMGNAEIAAMLPDAVANRGWWVLVNYPEVDEEFCWDDSEAGQIDDLRVSAEDMERQFQEELFRNWQEEGGEIRAFTPDELENYIDALRCEKQAAIEGYGRTVGQGDSRTLIM